MSGEADEAIEVQEEADDDEEPTIEVQEETGDEADNEEETPIEVQEPASAEAEVGGEKITVYPFYFTRGQANGSVRVRAGWRYEDGSVHSLQIDNTVPIDLAQMAEDLARSWHQRQLNTIAQQRAAQAQQQGSEADDPDGPE